MAYLLTRRHLPVLAGSNNPAEMQMATHIWTLSAGRRCSG